MVPTLHVSLTISCCKHSNEKVGLERSYDKDSKGGILFKLLFVRTDPSLRPVLGQALGSFIAVLDHR